MPDWEAALKAIGGLTAIGGLIDLAMYKADKKRLQDWLETWWLRFTDVKWSNFGRNEAELAIQILDRWAGPRLWSWKRWRFSLIVPVTAYLLILVAIFVVALLHNVNISSAFRNIDWPYLVYLPPVYIVPQVVTFAGSLSITRFIAAVVVRVGVGGLFGILSFAGLLLVHVLLLLYWGRIVWVLQLIPIESGRLLFSSIESSQPFSLGNELHRFIRFSDRHWDLGLWYGLLRQPTNRDLLIVFSVVCLNALMEIVANGLRIAFALVFLVSFAFRPVMEVLAAWWYNLMTSGKPFFTMLFGFVGSLVAVVQIIAK
jgi:hypothetical protein